MFEGLTYIAPLAIATVSLVIFVMCNTCSCGIFKHEETHGKIFLFVAIVMYIIGWCYYGGTIPSLDCTIK
jgi:hypothetical protein